MKGRRSLMLLFLGGGEHWESHFKWSLPSEQRAAESRRAGGSPLTLGRTSRTQDGGYQTLCCVQHGPSLSEEWGEERTRGGSAGLEMPRVGLKVPVHAGIELQIS